MMILQPIAIMWYKVLRLILGTIVDFPKTITLQKELAR